MWKFFGGGVRIQPTIISRSTESTVLFFFHSFTWFGVTAEIIGLPKHVIHVLICFRTGLAKYVLRVGSFCVNPPSPQNGSVLNMPGGFGRSVSLSPSALPVYALPVPSHPSHFRHHGSRLQSAGICISLPWSRSLFCLCWDRLGICKNEHTQVPAALTN